MQSRLRLYSKCFLLSIFQSGLVSQEEELKRHVISDVTILYKPYKQSDLLKAINDTLKSSELT